MRIGTVILVSGNGQCNVLCGEQIYVVSCPGSHPAWFREGVGAEIRLRSGVPVGLRSLCSNQGTDVKITVIETKLYSAPVAPSPSIAPRVSVTQSREITHPAPSRACDSVPEQPLGTPYEAVSPGSEKRALTQEERTRIRNYEIENGGALVPVAMFQKRLNAAYAAASARGVFLAPRKVSSSRNVLVPKKLPAFRASFGGRFRNICDPYCTGDD